MTAPERCDRLRDLLPTGRPGSLLWLSETDSTNRFLRASAAELPGGSAVLADFQTAGRGRLGRSFASPAGKGLYLSLLLKPAPLADGPGLITAGTAVAVRRALLRLGGPDTGIKWVNDLLCGGKKLCGILAEGVFTPGQPPAAVVGIGLNAGADETDFPAELRPRVTSLRMLGSPEIGLPELAAAVIAETDAVFPRLSELRESLYAEYRAACVTLGTRVRVNAPEGPVDAVAEDIGRDFALLARTEDGRLLRITAGEALPR